MSVKSQEGEDLLDSAVNGAYTDENIELFDVINGVWETKHITIGKSPSDSNFHIYISQCTSWL